MILACSWEGKAGVQIEVEIEKDWLSFLYAIYV